ncbi:MAG: DUF4145 domain-containing protein [bacterium]
MPWIEVWDGGPKQDVELDTFPTTCPYCGLQINAENRTASFSCRGGGRSPEPVQIYLEVVFQCPSQECSRLFIALYEKLTSKDPLFFVKTIPVTGHTRIFDDFVQEISPGFCQIWNEAYKAEQAGSTQICGMGYRKALEFFVKDYLIYQKSDEKTRILSTPLGTCISQYIEDPRIKACAQRAAWLGNDESHYLRKWEGKDIKDLKILIDLTVHWMNMLHLTDHYEDEMEGSSKFGLSKRENSGSAPSTG